MGTVADKYRYTLETKKLLGTALISKGAAITKYTPFRKYVDEVYKLEIGSENNISYYKFLDGINKVYEGGTGVSDEDYKTAEEYLQTVYTKLMPVGGESNE